MAASGRKCFECGRAVELFSGLMVNGAAYHARCWDGRIKPPEAGPGEARPSGGSKTAG